MAPGIKDAAMQEALIRAVNDEFTDSPNNVTVKRIRTLAETSLGLDEGFFKSHDKWNGRSKALINDEFNRLDEGGEPAKPTRKRKSPQTKTPAPKRSKKAPSQSSELSDVSDTVEESRAATPSDASASESGSLSALSESEEEIKPKKKGAPPPKKIAPKVVSRTMAEDTSDDDGVESDMSVVLDEAPKTKKSAQKPKAQAKVIAKDNAPDDVGSESDMSVLLDEAPKPKKKKAANGKAAKAPAEKKEPSAHEKDIKVLKEQLKKCGVTKVWQFEFKKVEADTDLKKINHLKKWLKDVGIEGRFSEAKAEEIKVKRELAADLESIGAVAVEEPRKRRSAAQAEQKLRPVVSDDDEDEDEEDDVGDVPTEAKVAAARQDMAFLGSEEESD